VANRAGRRFLFLGLKKIEVGRKIIVITPGSVGLSDDLGKINSNKRNIKKDANWNYLTLLMFGLLIFYLLHNEPHQQAISAHGLEKKSK